MKQQVVLDFLNLTGVVGLGLIDGHTQPYFSGIDQTLNFQQKEALAHGLQQVISTIPDSFKSFDFRFSRRAAHIYKLAGGLILLVVTNEALEPAIYDPAIWQLREMLENDPPSAVSTFRLLANSQAGSHTVFETQAPASESSSPTALSTASNAAPPAIAPDVNATPGWQEAIVALNALTDATAKYLGKIVVANTWRTSRPNSAALTSLELDRNGHFSLNNEAKQRDREPIASQDYQLIQQWVGQFVQRCSSIIRDYPEMVLQQALTDQQRAVLQISGPDQSS